ncbi:MAG: nuclear transport factor 2 family protein, partial [Gammaproteobacteria bacterium]|nr:nuclear transport factor 2 family protein [Gammaproteobacteria bacterium]
MNIKFQTQILELEERLRQAMLRSEVRVLDELIAPELIFTNHLGQLITKQDDLAMHQSGVLQLKELSPSEQHIQLNHGFAVVSVLMHLLGAYESTSIDFSIRYTRVWAVSSSGSL